MTKKNVRATALASVALLIAPMMMAGVAGSGVAGASGPTRLLTCTGKVTTKPATYTLSCADANAGWTDMTWSSWGAHTASGRGILRQNNCTPNCAAGKFINYRGTVTLSKVITTKKHGALFSEAVFHYSANHKAKVEIFGLAD